MVNNPGKNEAPSPPQHKQRPRLIGFEYAGPYQYFITICTYSNENLFIGNWPYAEIINILSSTAGKHGFDVLVYVFMPNHFHALVEGSEASDFREFIRLFKSQAGFLWKKMHGKTLWQKSYYDRVLRREDAAFEVALYILNNPVRGGLSEAPLDYPYSGSFTCNPVDICG